MGLVAAKCTQCGANIEVDETKEAGICKYCGTAFITEKAITNYNTYVTNNNNFVGANISVVGGDTENLLALAKNALSVNNQTDALKSVSYTHILAAEQKARSTYDNILRVVKDPEVCDPIRFLREREVVHFQRFGEALRLVQDNLDSRNFYAFNPAFDKPSMAKADGCNCGK